VLSLATRYPFDERGWGRALLVHLPASLLVSLVQVAGHTIVDQGLVHGTLRPDHLADAFLALFARTYHFGLLVYWTIAGIRWGLEHYKNQQVRASRLETRLAEARLEALRTQLQPHFLFNTLNTIAEMVHEDPEVADTMIAGLSGLLRRTLDLQSAQEIPLAEEIDLMSHYLDIQRARFGERLRVTVTVSDAASEARVPALVLQPIVENAIHHGLAARLDAGRIDVDARVEGAALVICVTDDGAADGDTINGAERVGIGNTRARLEAMYGGRASLALAPAEGRGARVTLRIPLKCE
jgi:LytS/YehU family sensor histidine kinase